MLSDLENVSRNKVKSGISHWSSKSLWLSLVCTLFFLRMFGTAQVWEGFPVPPSGDPVVIERFDYDMRGSVRLLVFWVGKSGVGGGWISRIRSSGTRSVQGYDGWEVLFGSKPDAVPGGHNRWGYARELAFWAASRENPSAPALTKTVFEGFMTRSSEESLADLRAGEGRQSNGTAYEGTESWVHPDRATVEIRRFLSDVTASYEDPSGIGRHYLGLLRSRPPDEARSLSRDNSIDHPYGFLTAVNSCISDVLTVAKERGSHTQLKEQKRIYVYNARYYSLEIKRIKHHERVNLGDHLNFEDVVEISFEAKRDGKGGGQGFDIWTASSGELAGIPLKIVDRPRWWLKVELTLKSPTPTKAVVYPHQVTEGRRVAEN